MMTLPRYCQKPKAPPIKSQGIKTKLTPLILASVKWDGEGRWIEPFLGSGAVLFNIQPDKALISDTNRHVIEVYKMIQTGEMSSASLRQYLEREGEQLEARGEEHYYAVRERFNQLGSPFDFVFLNRASFNGVIRFNSKGRFNVPFCKKVNRFRLAYITKICNQVAWVAKILQDKDWIFLVQDWRETLASVLPEDFVYLDPPYIGRHTDYFNSWSDTEADELAEAIKELSCGFAYSMWKKNKYRENEHLIKHFSHYPCVIYHHYYHVGSTENLRNAMEEALIISPDFLAPNEKVHSEKELTQLSLL
ncbi:Dam family site-specific DNA-(adenine-N6)-methyltransferase [Phormidium sp. CLA17]|uniref:DNA adenine methylase n=1 Tax=Leptolyngbya sp. Cla-17 TaxID=2803751 RepID=UPI0014924368|nr:Dam family site-specific DNA-(adenine-N6)-methyltransferase [Leptolyngbya sp. Cla-17]MBM0742565.1 Dam family site-specific DNA-(adenine-N6)-methyltransferase [Leptolyngbya sp. Cla-17]